MRIALLMVLQFCSSCVFASDDASKQVFVQGAIGAISVIGLIIFVGVYKLGNYLVRRMKEDASVWIQRCGGIAALFVLFLLFSLR